MPVQQGFVRLYSNTDLAYIAGFIDGEGTVSLKKNGMKWPTVLPYILVTNTNLAILEWIKLTLDCGGDIYRKRSTSEKWKEAYVLRYNTCDTRKVLPLICPYLKLKLKQAELIFEFEKIGSVFGNKEKADLKWNYLKQVQELNKRGPNV
jgi:hypothetical protein